MPTTTSPSVWGSSRTTAASPRLRRSRPAARLSIGDNSTCAASDQRGVPRALTGGDPCDAGAFEVRTGTFPPVVAAIPDQTIDEDGPAGPLPLHFADTNSASTGGNTITITPTGSLTTSTISQGGAFPNKTLTVTPPPDQNGGPLHVQVQVQAAGGGSPTTTSFDVNVTAVNDAPRLTRSRSRPSTRMLARRA